MSERWQDADMVGVPDELREPLRNGRLTQACPCGLHEAAGWFCSSCGRPTGPETWGRQEATEAQIAARRVLARNRAERGAVTKETANPEAVA